MDSPPSVPTSTSKSGKRKNSSSEAIPLWGYFVIGSFLMAIGATIFIIKKGPSPTREDPKVVTTEIVESEKQPSKPVPIPNTLETPPKDTPPKVRSNAEFILSDHPDNPNASILSKTQREIALLSLKEPLWVYDFRKLAELSRADQPAALKVLFLHIFGKPDTERVYSVNAKVVSFLDVRRDYSVTAYTYSNRLLNPTTDKREDLIVEFVDGLFSRAAGTSGHECLR